MKVVYTEPALDDLGEITAWLTRCYPGLGRAVERRLEVVIAHVARWPESMRRSTRHPDVRIAPLGRYPYKIFYRVRGDTIDFAHSSHRSRTVG